MVYTGIDALQTLVANPMGMHAIVQMANFSKSLKQSATAPDWTLGDKRDNSQSSA